MLKLVKTHKEIKDEKTGEVKTVTRFYLNGVAIKTAFKEDFRILNALAEDYDK